MATYRHGNPSIFQTLSHDIQDGDLDPDEAAKIAAAKMNEGQSHSRGWYRVNAIRGLSGGRKLVPQVTGAFQEVSVCFIKGDGNPGDYYDLYERS